MMKRILLAGVLGGVAMFVWASIAHLVLPLGTTGIKEIPNEESVLAGMQTQMGGASGDGLGAKPNAARTKSRYAAV
jgi:hypothetical protein